MKKAAVAIIAILLLAGCVHRSKDTYNDKVNNPFYIEYVRIYQNYGKVPYDSTQAALKVYLDKFSNNSQAWTFLGRVFIDLRQNDKAEAAYRTALYYQPHYGPALTGLGNLYSWTDKFDSAQLLIRQGIAAGDSSDYSFLDLAIVDIEKGDSSGASHAISSMSHRDSLDNDGLVYLTVVQAELHREAGMQRTSAALRTHQVPDSLLTEYLDKKITAIEFFKHKRREYEQAKH